jgi:hypothetical protein
MNAAAAAAMGAWVYMRVWVAGMGLKDGRRH